MSHDPLNSDEVERYARHIVLPEIGGAGQQKLKAARVLVIGAGGLGSPLIQYLAAAGIGTIGIVDDDDVALSNLQRQVLHTTTQVGKPKVDSAAKAVAQLNPHVRVETHHMRLNAENASELVGAYDLVADGCDNFQTRYLLADACETEEKTLVSAAVGRFDGHLTTLKPFASDAKGLLNPRYIDIFPEPPPDHIVPSCAEAGILGALTGVVGSMQALEVVKQICGVGDGLIGRLLLIDSMSWRIETLNYARAAQ